VAGGDAMTSEELLRTWAKGTGEAAVMDEDVIAFRHGAEALALLREIADWLSRGTLPPVVMDRAYALLAALDSPDQQPHDNPDGQRGTGNPDDQGVVGPRRGKGQ